MSQSKIYIIDDNEEVCESIKFLFHATLKYSSQFYANPLIFLKDFSKDTKGCIIVDIFMPYMNGVDLIKQIKEINKHVKIISLSGNGNFTYDFKEAGADAFIKKPFKISELLEKVNQLMQ